jgi:predicted nuclease of predicted toxin-antitoxin system
VRLLIDTCVWGGARNAIVTAGHDAIWAADWPEDPGDEEILARAYAEGRTLVTLDKDFGELAIVHGSPHRGILRLCNLRSTQQAVVCLHVLALHAEELSAGAIITAEPRRIRIRPAE